ncbi:hypothetical protein SAMN04487981_113229 [Streptomyces sp. cf386]|uniref:hypothetical protein n=1 Tax=Streptomyces sp. cf386 TaxID=1761904 RepID=UPI000881C95B|nr:hypothetical protein [Streptomyces sp. cf386]SDO81608.1 hypothetical protein SAMN04487981_113229 [Streptomyces sp. cf386]
MGQRLRFGAVVAAGAAVLVLAGCGSPPTDYSEVVTFTDEHGRACTATVVVDQEQNEGNDYEVTSLDCEYPPEGKTPGLTRYRPMPERGSN